jgi:hypothetical protein
MAVRRLLAIRMRPVWPVLRRREIPFENFSIFKK